MSIATNSNFRCYIFCHSYLSSIQKGVQASHCVAELSLLNHPIFDIWAKTDKTMILLEGGTCDDLKSILTTFEQDYIGPSAAFFEDSSLNNMITSVGIIVSDQYWKRDDMITSIISPSMQIIHDGKLAK